MTAEQVFIGALGKKKLDQIKERNWVKFKDPERHNRAYRINFLRKDGKGDNVIHTTINYCYGFWWMNYEDEDYEKVFDSFEKLQKHYASCEDEILENGDELVDF